MLVAPEGPGAPQLPSREAKGLQERQRKTRVHRARRERSSMPRLWGDVSFTWWGWQGDEDSRSGPERIAQGRVDGHPTSLTSGPTWLQPQFFCL